MLLNSQGDAVLPPLCSVPRSWQEKIAGCLEELSLRNLALPDDFLKGANLPRLSWLPQDRPSLANSARPGQAAVLIKYGSAQFLIPAFEKGKWRIAPASKYDDESLTLGQRDVELIRELRSPPSRAVIEVPDRQTGQTIQKIRPIGNLVTTMSIQTNYYVQCLSHAYSPRLFSDFSANACLLVNDIGEFARRMLAATRSVLPGWRGRFRSVTYFDPYNPTQGIEDIIFFSKHFRYCYQQECRFVWIPDKAVNNLRDVFVEIGSMSDISELILL
jgi:hypothetical protein